MCTHADIKTFPRLFIIPLILLAAIQITGCGSSGATAPSGSSINSVALTAGKWDPITGSTVTIPADQVKGFTYRVSVSDSTGAPMNGILVDVSGALTGTAVAFPGSFTTGVRGYYDFLITAPVYDFKKIPSPTGVSAVPGLAVGGLSGGPVSFDYSITALDNIGETLPSPTASTLISSGSTTASVLVTWTAVPGAIGYNVYRGRGGPQGLYANIASGSITTYTDTGGGLAGAAPPSSDSTGQANNAVTGTLTFSSGAALKQQVVGF